ncbi:hypothetical protein [Pigmentiphaga sp.]|uniref:hypothetical protein n=1 Tax=Pigmentiphaga sp. TaxID=1977564 RepID=UPI0025D5047D|nr:hypothetical protein [Pigmentiphaga sp.]
MRDEIPVTEQEEAAWREMERRQAQAAPQLDATPAGSAARWYAVDKSGAATLCVDEPDALMTAAEATRDYPNNAPYRAVQLFESTPQPPSGQSAAPDLLADLRAAREHITHVSSSALLSGDVRGQASIRRECALVYTQACLALGAMESAIAVLSTPADQAAPAVPHPYTDDMLVAAMEASVAGRPSVDDDTYVRSILDAARGAAPTPPAVDAVPLIARAIAEWHEDDGPVMWWAWCGHEWAGEPPWCGTPLSSDWPGYHTHWTPMVAVPAVPAAVQHAGSPQGSA